jgi:predicted PurR-regulated permease PerM
MALSVVALGVVTALLYFGRLFFINLAIAVIIAFILQPFVSLLMRLRMPRALASFLVCALALLMLYVIGVGAYSQLTDVYEDLPTYGQRIGDLVDGVRQRIQGIEETTYKLLLPGRQRKQEQEEERQRAAEQPSASRRRGRTAPAAPPVPPPDAAQQTPPQRMPISDYIYSSLSSFYEVLLMASFIPFLVYFMLSWQEHINRSFLQFFQGEDRLVASRSLTGIAGMVRAFVVGNFLLWLVLALSSTVCFWLIHLRYPMLVGPLSAILSLTPYIGLPLAIVPPLFSALGMNQFSTYVFVFVITAGLHLITLNVLYPKVVGARVHLNALAVTLSLMFWSFLWGAAGLFLAIPLTAGIKAVCDNVKGLQAFGKFLGD